MSTCIYKISLKKSEGQNDGERKRTPNNPRTIPTAIFCDLQNLTDLSKNVLLGIKKFDTKYSKQNMHE